MLLLNAFSNPTVFIALIVALLIGITVHEYAHAWTANYLGDDTARLMGRLTLNPLKHLDLIGSIMILIIGFGWGKPVPYNPNKIQDPNGSIKVALAGMTANLLVAFILGLAIRLGTFYGIGIENSPILSFIDIIIAVNLMLIAFNIIPIPPLDGSKIIENSLSYESILRYEQIGPMVLLAIVAIQYIFNMPILFTVMEPIIRFLHFVTTGMPNLFGLN